MEINMVDEAMPYNHNYIYFYFWNDAFICQLKKEIILFNK